MLDFAKTIVKPNGDNIFHLRAVGRIEAADVVKATTELETALATNDRIKILVDARELEGVTADALIADFRAGMKMFDKLRKIDRIALVTGLEWVRIMASVEARLLPFAELKSFPSEEYETAVAWLTSPSDKATVMGDERSPVITLTKTPNNIYRTDVYGFVSRHDFDGVVEGWRTALASPEPIRAITIIHEWRGVDPVVIMSPDLMQLKLDALQKVERYAVVGGPEWAERIMNSVNPIIKMEVRHFNADEQEAALEWVTQG